MFVNLVLFVVFGVWCGLSQHVMSFPLHQALGLDSGLSA